MNKVAFCPENNPRWDTLSIIETISLRTFLTKKTAHKKLRNLFCKITVVRHIREQMIGAVIEKII